MESEREKPSSSALYTGGESGAGGKFKKPSSRKPPATPYDRPTSNQAPQRRDGGWLSKLVDPACRLIAGGATKILPSFFSKSPSTADDLENCGAAVTPNGSNDDNHTLGITKSTGEAGPSKVADRLKVNSECNELERHNITNLCDDSELSKIEQLVKGKNFSRDEINRLTEILNSRVVDLIDVEREKKKPILSAGEEAKGTLSAHESPIPSVEGIQEDMNRVILGNSKPHLQSNMRDEVIASPVDIARAYMGSRTSEMGIGSYSIISKDERTLQQGDEFASKQFFPPPSPMSSTCWPGAMLQDQRGYTTPQSQRGTFSLHNLPRTPYSRTIYSKSKTKLTQSQADSRCLNISSTPFQQSRTPIYRQVKSRTDIVDDRYGSAGPIRRIRNKFVSEAPARGFTSPYSVRNAPSQVEKSNVSKSFLPVVETNSEPGGTSGNSSYQSEDHTAHNSEEGIPVLNSPSSRTVRKILEHLDRHKPTPKEMADELKLATAWKRPSSEDSDVMPKESTGLGHWGRFDFQKTTDLVDQKYSAEGNDDRGNSNSELKPPETDTVNAIAKASSTGIDGLGVIRDANAGPSFDIKNISNSQIKSAHEKASAGPNNGQKDTSQLWPRHDQPKKPLFHSSSTKPTLKSISISKRDPQCVVSSDNGLGFTFPVSASAGVLSEPPTPSIMPSFSASGLPRPKEVPLVVPSYSFGTKKSMEQRIVFSFPSTSSASIHDDVSDLKFNFGSDEKTRVSFSSVGKDAICF